MRLYRVEYYEWDCTFSDLVPRRTLSVGKDAEEAIANAKRLAARDARAFSAEEIKTVMGHKIMVR